MQASTSTKHDVYLTMGPPEVAPAPQTGRIVIAFATVAALVVCIGFTSTGSLDRVLSAKYTSVRPTALPAPTSSTLAPKNVGTVALSATKEMRSAGPNLASLSTTSLPIQASLGQRSILTPVTDGSQVLSTKTVLGYMALATMGVFLLRQLANRLVSWTSGSSTSDLAMMAVVGITADRDVNHLLDKYASEIAGLKTSMEDVLNAQEYDDIWIMRFIACNSGDVVASEEQARATIAWRAGEGKSVIDAATAAVKAATENGGWNNAPVVAAAPHSAIIAPYVTPSQFLTISLNDTEGSADTNDNDLVYIIRAAGINDVELMSKATVEQVVEFFLYAKEVNYQVADYRTRNSGRLVTVITANDLTGISIFGDATFRKVLSDSSKKAVKLYPMLAGPTLLLNLPRVLGALIKVFTPLFPKSVQEKLKFAQGPLKEVKDLKELSSNPAAKEKFLAEISSLLLL